jgi:predicted dehydrogenase
MAKGNKVIKAGIGYTVGNILIKGINFLTLPLFSRLLTTEEFGVYNVFASYEAILYVVVGLSIHSSVRSANLEFKGQIKKYTSSVSLIYLLNALILLATAVFWGNQLSKLLDFSKIEIVLLVLYSLGSSLLALYNNLISLEYSYGKYLAASLFNSVGNVLLSLVLILTIFRDHRDVGRIVGGTVTICLLALILLLSIYKQAKPRINKVYWKFAVKYSLPIVPHGISQVLLAQFDRIMIRSMVGNAEAGIYSLAENIKLILTIITDSISAACASQKSEEPEFDGMFYTENYDELLEKVDAVYIVSKPEKHYIDTKKALLAGKHVLCESPIALKEADCEELYSIAEEHGLVLMDAIKTAYSTAYERLVLLAKSGKIGKVVSVDAVCTSLRDGISIAGTDLTQKWNSMCGWAPAALLPVFQILGTEYRKKVITTKFLDEAANMDAFTKIDFTYDDAVASIKVAKAAKSEGELIVTGTKGYIYVPAPWWKTDYFEVRYENPEDNQRFFYQLDGEGIRYEIVAFAKSVEVKKPMNYVEKGVSKSIAKIIESFNDRTDMIVI